MSPMVTAILLFCSTGDPQIARMIEEEAIRQEVDPAWALVIGVKESGLKAGNPMGVQACYGAKAKRRGTKKCVQLGVRSLYNRWEYAKTHAVSEKHRKECKASGQYLTGCRALIVYNGSKNRYKYGRSGADMVRKIHRRIQPET